MRRTRRRATRRISRRPAAWSDQWCNRPERGARVDGAVDEGERLAPSDDARRGIGGALADHLGRRLDADHLRRDDS